MVDLVNENNVERYEETYRRGTNHLYPNENIVRLIKWFFKGEGRVLDYGFGPGENLMHLLSLGYLCEGIEVSKHAIQLVENKIKKYPEYKEKVNLYLLNNDQLRLPFDDNSLDYILSNQVIYYLANEENIIMLLNIRRRKL